MMRSLSRTRHLPNALPKGEEQRLQTYSLSDYLALLDKVNFVGHQVAAFRKYMLAFPRFISTET